MLQERENAVTMKGNPVTLIGSEIRSGDQAPNFTVLMTDQSEHTLSDTKGKIRLITTVPSLDTPTCDQETRRFNEEASAFGSEVEVLTISADLPFAQKRWCGAKDIDRVLTLSDHREMSFGKAYGTCIKEKRLECRAVFVVNADDIVTYAEYVPEMTHYPDYDAALKAVKAEL
ncbi:thiol peroxidase [Natribacillus halophilus]|uniref:Thiol peroxidase n=1 Tax=Natribacillus halophilus TaxID=549003 RepID=A0A1G8LYP6_9BACI|nr:thiol peroxidase [Natribacillus halophilus]SDI60834.1 thiol peroxidase (atypical 2-Cys peroxiredoxin) [Natribacillus halophilus]